VFRECRIVHREVTGPDTATKLAVELIRRAPAVQQRFESRDFFFGRLRTAFELAGDDGERICGDAGVEGRATLQLRHRVFLNELPHGGDEFER
jgi:hypothetical protein